MDRIFTATAIIFHSDTVLLIEHLKSGYLLPPGGCLEPGEDPVQAVRREIMEEVGLDLHLIDASPFTHPAVTTLPVPWTVQVIDIPANELRPSRQHIDFVYRAYPHTTTVTVQESEIGGYQWAQHDASPPPACRPDSHNSSSTPDEIWLRLSAPNHRKVPQQATRCDEHHRQPRLHGTRNVGQLGSRDLGSDCLPFDPLYPRLSATTERTDLVW